MKYAAVGLICLVAGVTLGAGASKPAQKWKYRSFKIQFESEGSRDGFRREDSDYLGMFQPSDIVFAAPSPDGSGWSFIVKDEVK